MDDVFHYQNHFVIMWVPRENANGAGERWFHLYQDLDCLDQIPTVVLTCLIFDDKTVK